MPTPPHMHAAGPSTVAPVVVTTQRLPSSIASSDPTTDILAASQAAPAPDQTQTASWVYTPMQMSFVTSTHA